jgi:hypothetical protein
MEGGALPPHRFENGIQHFESGLSRPVDHRQSLAEIALLYRGRQSKNAPRSFNNDNIAQLNERGIRTGNLGPQTTTVAHSFRPELMAQNQAPALPQSDREQFRRVSRSLGNQQRHPTADQSISTPDSDSSAQSQSPTVQDKSILGQSSATTNGPQRGSPLMFLIILTGLGVAGVLYWLKR